MNFPDRFSTFPRLTLAELPKKTVFQKTCEISGLTGLAYIPTIHLATTFLDEGIDLKSWQSTNFIGGTGVKRLPVAKQPRPYLGSLQAWDPIKQEQAWSVPQDHFWNAGTLCTAGNLVFQGRADGKLVAYNATTGQAAWTFDLGLGISAPPITYRLNGRQYLALLVGWGGGAAGLGQGLEGWAYGVHRRRLVAFSLEGKVELPKQPAPYFPAPLVIPGYKIDPALAARGQILWGRCGWCHGRRLIASGMAPDLRASGIPLAAPLFEQVVRGGGKVIRGMPAYPDLNDADLAALQHFIRQTAHQTNAPPRPTSGGQ